MTRCVLQCCFATAAATILVNEVRAEAPRYDLPSAERGRVLFERAWEAGNDPDRDDDGLGPLFNARSCAQCHSLGGLGGGGNNDKNVDLVSVVVPDEFRQRRPEPARRMAGIGMRDGLGLPALGPRDLAMDENGDRVDELRQMRELLNAAAKVDPELAGGFMLLHAFGTDPRYAARRESILKLQGTKHVAGEYVFFQFGERVYAFEPGRSPALFGKPDEVPVRLQRSARNSTALFGAGLIDKIPRRWLEEAEQEQRQRQMKISGKALGRFGWRGQTETLRDFVGGACEAELGLSVRPTLRDVSPRMGSASTVAKSDISRTQLDDLVWFVRTLPAPKHRSPREEAEESRFRDGLALFNSVGCNECHRSFLGGVHGIYSDLLVHDMGPELADAAAPAGRSLGSSSSSTRNGYFGRSEFFAETSDVLAREWRTPPLWGAADSAPYLHDGRAATFDEAIRLHGGEAEDVTKKYVALTEAQRDDILLFLSMLEAPR